MKTKICLDLFAEGKQIPTGLDFSEFEEAHHDPKDYRSVDLSNNVITEDNQEEVVDDQEGKFAIKLTVILIVMSLDPIVCFSTDTKSNCNIFRVSIPSKNILLHFF